MPSSDFFGTGEDNRGRRTDNLVGCHPIRAIGALQLLSSPPFAIPLSFHTTLQKILLVLYLFLVTGGPLEVCIWTPCSYTAVFSVCSRILFIRVSFHMWWCTDTEDIQHQKLQNSRYYCLRAILRVYWRLNDNNALHASRAVADLERLIIESYATVHITNLTIT